MGALKTYNANRIKVVFAGATLQEFGKDEFVRIKYNADAYELTMSVDGRGVRERSNDNSATIEIILMYTSVSNAIMTGIYQGDLAAPNGAGIAPLAIRDLNSDAQLHFAPEAFISKQPDASWARGVNELIWTLTTDDLISVHSGH